MRHRDNCFPTLSLSLLSFFSTNEKKFCRRSTRVAQENCFLHLVTGTSSINVSIFSVVLWLFLSLLAGFKLGQQPSTINTVLTYPCLIFSLLAGIQTGATAFNQCHMGYLHMNRLNSWQWSRMLLQSQLIDKKYRLQR